MNHQDFWNDNELAQKVLQENKGLKETVEAVSYTHLDVYKRQIHSCNKS